MNKFHNDPLYDFLFDKEFKFWERSVWEEQAPLFSFGDDVNVIPPWVKRRIWCYRIKFIETCRSITTGCILMDIPLSRSFTQKENRCSKIIMSKNANPSLSTKQKLSCSNRLKNFSRDSNKKGQPVGCPYFFILPLLDVLFRNRESEMLWVFL